MADRTETEAKQRWSGAEPLDAGRTILLEASAGTGKTWQIEGLVTRLVAEYAIPIERILVITFTKAATADLRARVRGRLVRARDAMDSGAAPADDTIIAALLEDPSARSARRSLLAAAVSAFDQAAISTIHGFCQRMLDQLAFESSQEPGLILLTDPSDVIEQLVDDALATVYAEAEVEELQVLGDMGWGRAALMALVKGMTGAVAPVIEPAFDDLPPDARAPLAAAKLWLRDRRAFRDWFDSPECEQAVQAVKDELAKTKGKRFNRMPVKVVGDHLEAVKTWLGGPALRASRTTPSSAATPFKNLMLDRLEARWKGDPEELAAFEGRKLFEHVSAIIERQEVLRAVPLVVFAAKIRQQVDAELGRGGYLTYSTMLSRLAERIAEQGDDGPLAEGIRGRFDVALVDEFQDTDGAQWPVIRSVFAQASRRLLIIGDPKQAIYAFRGADVHVYMDAAKRANTRATMGTNWRSDGAYIRGMNHLWWADSGAFELSGVDYESVGWPSKNEGARIRGLGAPGRQGKAFELRWADGTTLGGATRLVGQKGKGESLVAELAAREAARLLSGGCEIETGEGWRRLRPGDIAVLVRANYQAEQTRKQLERLGIPSVSAGRGSVMASPVVDWLAVWLDAVADPGRDRAARALATTPLFGWTAADLAAALAAVDAQAESAAATRWVTWLRAIGGWAQAWPSHGFARVFEAALDSFGVVESLLGAYRGERFATDLRHLVELCHAHERRTRVGPAGLGTWLRAARDESAGSGGEDVRALRLESDARSVQILTIHKSKGLEFPVVLLPFCWAESRVSDSGGPLQYHGPAANGEDVELRLNLQAKGTRGRGAAVAVAEEEARQEQVRLLYVALTRAKHHCVTWLGPFGAAGKDLGASALGRLVLRQRDANGKPLDTGSFPAFATPTKKNPSPPDPWESIRGTFDALCSTSNGTIGWSVEPAVASAPAPRVALESVDDGALSAQPWPEGRHLGSRWQVSSYTAMVRGRSFDADEPMRLSQGTPATESPEPESGAEVALREPGAVTATAGEPDLATDRMRGGPEIGTWVHAVFEHLDFQTTRATDGRDLATLIAEVGVRNGVRRQQDYDVFAAALPGMLDTPVGGGATKLPADFSLRDLKHSDRLDELGFDLSIGGLAGATLDVDGADAALRGRQGEAGWDGGAWLREVLERTEDKGKTMLPRIKGILTGFIDLTFRAKCVDGQQRYFVADYKTNRIGPKGRRRDSRKLHYTRPWLAWEMAHHGYHLQALLYTVALHRMLKQRLPDYDYETHMGGHLYLFLRGMHGPEPERQGLGVYFDRWPEAVVLGIDAALGGVTALGGAAAGESS